MLEKQINFQGYTKAILLKIYDNNTILCNLEKWELVEDMNKPENITEQLVSTEENISFDEGNYPFEFTEEDLLTLRPLDLEA